MAVFILKQYDGITFLLSSKTVFMFSIHTASTGPSNIIHFLKSVVLEAYSRNVLAKIPAEIMKFRDTENTPTKY